jgi:hypothetical protein
MRTAVALGRVATSAWKVTVQALLCCNPDNAYHVMCNNDTTCAPDFCIVPMVRISARLFFDPAQNLWVSDMGTLSNQWRERAAITCCLITAGHESTVRSGRRSAFITPAHPQRPHGMPQSHMEWRRSPTELRMAAESGTHGGAQSATHIPFHGLPAAPDNNHTLT